jgi:hypothetical protein
MNIHLVGASVVITSTIGEWSFVILCVNKMKRQVRGNCQFLDDVGHNVFNALRVNGL